MGLTAVLPIVLTVFLWENTVVWLLGVFFFYGENLSISLFFSYFLFSFSDN